MLIPTYLTSITSLTPLSSALERHLNLPQHARSPRAIPPDPNKLIQVGFYVIRVPVAKLDRDIGQHPFVGFVVPTPLSVHIIASFRKPGDRSIDMLRPVFQTECHWASTSARTSALFVQAMNVFPLEVCSNSKKRASFGAVNVQSGVGSSLLQAVKRLKVSNNSR